MCKYVWRINVRCIANDLIYENIYCSVIECDNSAKSKRKSVYHSAIRMVWNTVQVAEGCEGPVQYNAIHNNTALLSIAILDINPSSTKCDRTSVVGNGSPHTLS